MKVIKLRDLSQKDYLRIVKRSFGTNEKIMPEVQKIICDVQEKGDKTIYEKYQKRFGKDKYQSIETTKEEIKQAYTKVSNDLINALRQMVKNIIAVHKVQLPKKTDIVVETEKGIKVWRLWRAIEKVGLYVPGGKAIYPSSVLMSAIPAQIAGCREIILCSPPGSNGQIPPATLVAGDLIGLKKCIRLGALKLLLQWHMVQIVFLKFIKFLAPEILM